MNKKHFNLALILAPLLLFVNSCSKHDEHQHTDENELITRVEVYLVDSLSKDTLFAAWSDMDGLGGNNPILPDSLKLKQGKVYVGRVKFYSNHDAVSYHDITEEIQTEGKDHLICYTVQTMSMPPTTLSIARTDKDANGLELGLNTLWNAQNRDFGSVRTSLKHQPNIKNGQCDVGETDVEIEFPFVVK
jgi:hypothetical protein